MCNSFFNMQLPLPAELIDHIFSFLQEYPSALKACSKALPLCSRLAERYLYANIVIDPQAPDVSHLILKNPRLLGCPRTLEIRSHFDTPAPISIISAIPRMANLVSLKICGPCRPHYEFFSTFRNCIQQSSFQELQLFHFPNLPLSILDGARNIKRLTLYDCAANEPISTSLPLLSLETLVLSNYQHPCTHRWAMRWVSHLTSLKLQEISLDFDWAAFPELLAECSNSLTELHLDMSDCMCYVSMISQI